MDTNSSQNSDSDSSDSTISLDLDQIETITESCKRKEIETEDTEITSSEVKEGGKPKK